MVTTLANDGTGNLDVNKCIGDMQSRETRGLDVGHIGYILIKRGAEQTHASD